MLNISEKLIVALDVDTKEEAEKFAKLLYPKVKMFKIGSQLFTAYGPEIVRIIGNIGARVFLDLKFHDIPNTVRAATSSASSICIDSVPITGKVLNVVEGVKGAVLSPIFMMTVHTLGGKDMLVKAVEGASDKAKALKIKKPFIVGVTCLTSDCVSADTPKRVLEAAKVAKDAGLDGVVCAAAEVSMIRKEFGQDFIIVTPGIRPKGSSFDDQARVATALEAIEAGANFIVVGRPILKAADPLKAVEDIL
jgi:orotidine-5'-phosphate decarboxylase